MSSTDHRVSVEDRAILLQVARQSIEHGLRAGRAVPVILADYPESLWPLRATFVTLKMGQELRGCIGTLEARLALVADIADNAFAAAFKDPRFPPLRREEFPLLDLQISILSPATPIQVRSERELLAQLRPGIDGLILRAGHHRATFLPAVWDTLPDAVSFLAHLKQKAGLSTDFWSDDMEFERYFTESFGDSDSGNP